MSGFRMIFEEIESCRFFSRKYILNKIEVTGEIVEFPRGCNESKEKREKKATNQNPNQIGLHLFNPKSRKMNRRQTSQRFG